MPILYLPVTYMGVAGVISDLSLYITHASSRAFVELERHSLCMGAVLKAKPPQINAIPLKQGYTTSQCLGAKIKNLSSGKRITSMSQWSFCKGPALR